MDLFGNKARAAAARERKAKAGNAKTKTSGKAKAKQEPVLVADGSEVIDRDQEQFDLDVPEKCGIKITITILKCTTVDGFVDWYAGYWIAGQGVSSDSDLGISPRYPTRRDAYDDILLSIFYALQEEWVVIRGDKKSAAVKTAMDYVGNLKDAEVEKNKAVESNSTSSVVLPAMKIGELSAAESKKLEKHEGVIEKNLKSFFDVGVALAAINEGRLYRETHATFEAYCGERWDFGRQYAYRLIDAASVVKNLSPNGDVKHQKLLPATESQARALSKIKEPEKQAEVWEEILDAAPKGKDGPRVTAKFIEEKVAESIGEPLPRKQKEDHGVADKAKAEKKASGGVDALGGDSLEDDLAHIEWQIGIIANDWTTSYQRKQICDLLRKLAKKYSAK
jgi:uncharacterized protein YdaU (DUF1376 family)